MAGKWTEIIKLRFKGKRFTDAALDASALSEVLAMQKILAEAASTLWKVAHPDRERLPKNYGEASRVVLRHIESGSVIAPLEVEQVANDGQHQEWIEEIEDLKQAAAAATAAYRAASKDEPLPNDFPKQLVPIVSKFGENLDDDDVVEIEVAGKPKVAYSKAARERLTQVQDKPHVGTVEITGRVLEADVKRGLFQLWPDDKKGFPIPLSEAHEKKVLDALRDHASVTLKVRGRAETQASGQVNKFLDVERITLSADDQFDDSAPNIEDAIASIFSDVPEAEWKKLPKDGAANLDHYLYGAPKREA